MTERRARSPGKLILSGEHAVVHGAPALAMAVAAYAQVEAVPLKTDRWEVVLPGSPTASCTLEEAYVATRDMEERHRRFLRGDLPVGDVAPEPSELLLAAAARTRPEHGWRLTFSSDIPLGAGMGSSAAFLLALFKALRPEWDPHTLYENALACEHYQHGTSSGLDVAVSLSGGMIRMQKGERNPIALPDLPDFQLFFTGRPASTTGECVAKVSERFPDGHPLWQSFTRVTEAAREALQDQNHDAWKNCIRENHRLLMEIGVVPKAVQDVIAHIEAAGGAAKLCGAGSVRGESGGILLALGARDESLPGSWKRMNLQGTEHGVACLKGPTT